MVKTPHISDAATKADLNKTVKSAERILRAEILRVEERLEGVEERLTNKMDGVETKLDKILSQLDGFVGRVDDLTNDNEIGADQIHQLHEDAQDHEKRITKLESPAH